MAEQNYNFFEGLGKVFTSTVNAVVTTAETVEKAVGVVEDCVDVCALSTNQMKADAEGQLLQTSRHSPVPTGAGGAQRR